MPQAAGNLIFYLPVSRKASDWVAMSTAVARPRTKAERTRERVLDAAERHFAEHGFQQARLEDIAAEVGVRRAAIFYHFADKRALYEAAMRRAFGAVLSRVQPLLARPLPLAQRIEAAVGAWVDLVGERPSIARLLLREAASTGSIVPGDGESEALLERLRVEIAAAARRGELHPIEPDPFHLISPIVGATVFYVAALPRLMSTPFDPLEPGQLAAHRRDVLRITRRLLGIPPQPPGSRIQPLRPPGEHP